MYSLQMHGTMKGSVPFIMDNSHVCPVDKNKCGKSEKSNYHPIALLSCMSKILEKIIYKSLYEYCVSHDLLIKENSGLRWMTTVNYLYVCAIFLDVANAFDPVWHNELILNSGNSG